MQQNNLVSMKNVIINKKKQQNTQCLTRTWDIIFNQQTHQ